MNSTAKEQESIKNFDDNSVVPLSSIKEHVLYNECKVMEQDLFKMGRNLKYMACKNIQLCQ